MSARRRPSWPAVLVVLAAAGVALALVPPAGGAGAGTGGERTTPEPPPDPDADVLGWEDGYWYDEPIEVNQSDGLDPGERAAFLARTMARVERLRGLEFAEPVAVEFVGREELAARRTGEFGLPADDQLWEALFVFGEDTNATGAVPRLYRASVVAYAAEEGADRVVVANRDPDRPQVSAGVLAHELVHVLQDQHFDLGRPRYRRRTLDGELGKDGLVEGEAAYVQRLYAERCGAAWDCVGPPPLGWSGARIEGPRRFHRLTFQPYSDGAHYVATLRDRGGWAAVNAAHRRPPASTELVIHPDLEDRPVPMSFEDRARNGWTRIGAPQTVGEAGAYVLLWRPLFDEGGVDRDGPEVDGPYDVSDYDDTPTAGWGNDRLVAYANGGRRGYVWKTVWETPRDAREFAATYRRQLRRENATRVAEGTWRIRSGPFADAFRVRRTGRTVVIVNGPSVAALADVRPPGGRSPTATDAPGASPTAASPGRTTAAATASEGTPTATPGFGVAAAAVALVAALVAVGRSRPG